MIWLDWAIDWAVEAMWVLAAIYIIWAVCIILFSRDGL